jgi:uncharacterized membrane protein YadS
MKTKLLVAAQAVAICGVIAVMASPPLLTEPRGTLQL